MTIREKVARAICLSEGECRNCDGVVQHFRGVSRDGKVHERDRPCPYIKDANAAITALLEAAAEEGWRMCRVEATEEMVKQAAKTPGMKAVDGAIVIAMVHGFKLEPSDWHNSPIADAFRAMLAAAPKFELDK